MIKACIISTLFFLILTLASTTQAKSVDGVERHENYSWNFSISKNLSEWEVGGVSETYLSANGLELKGEQPTIVSPQGLDVMSYVLRLKVSSPVTGPAAVGVFPATGEGIFRKVFEIRGDGKEREFNTYDIYLGNVIPGPPVAIDRVVVQLPDNSRAARYITVESIDIFKPSTVELIRVLWSEFWDIEFIDTKAATVSNVNTPRVGHVYFLTALYILMVVVTIVVAIYTVALKKNITFTKVVSVSVSTAFIIGAFFYTLRMDYNWLAMWYRDARAFTGKDVKERISDRFGIFSRDFSTFIDLMDLMKDKLPEDATVRPAVKVDGDPMAVLGKYFALPLMTSKTAQYLWVFEDDVRYDQETLSLVKDFRVVASPVKPLAAVTPHAVVYEVVDNPEGGVR